MPAVHDCPQFLNTAHNAAGTAFFRLASSNTMLGDFPPSSIETRFKVGPASDMILRPVEESPVKDILSTLWLFTRASPTVSPEPERGLDEFLEYKHMSVDLSEDYQRAVR